MNNNNWLRIWPFLCFLIIRCDSFLDPPHIEAFTFPSHVVANKNISAICSAKDATFSWFKDGKMLTSSSKVSIKSEEDYTVIIINAVSVESGGNYTCIAMNKFGISSQSTILTVITPPKWLIDQFDLVAVIGEKVSLECLTEGLPKEIVNWQRTGENETITASMPVNLLHGSRILNAINGEYDCIVDNMTPANSEDPIKAKIPARLDDKFTKVTVKKGYRATLLCEAIGDPPLSIIWKTDGKELQKIKGRRYEIFEMLTTKNLKSELFLREVGRTDGQMYTCITENAYGKDKKDINLLVIDVPSIPLDLNVQEAFKRGISVSWSAPYTGNSPITKYVIQYWMKSESGGRHRLEEKEVASDQVSALIENLHPGVSYELAITAENALGRGEPSEIVSFRTGEEKPSGPPVDVNVDIKGTESLIVTWKHPAKSERNGQLKGYYVGHKIHFDSSHPYSFKKVHYVPEKIQAYIIRNLQKDTEYSIIVKAFNSAGSGPPSQDVIVRTLVGDLPSAPIVSVVSTTENSIKLQCQSNGNKFPITGYVIHYRKEEESWQRVSVTSTNESSYNLTGLQSGAFYQTYIAANNDYGEGYPSNLVLAKTSVDDGNSLLAGIEQQPKIHMTHAIPVTACILTAIVVSVAVLVWVLKAKSRRNLERSILEDKHFIFATAETHKHDHIDKTRSLSAYHDPALFRFSTPYETMLMKDGISDGDLKDGPNKRMKSFLSQKMEDRLLPNAVMLKKQQQWERRKMHASIKSGKNLDTGNHTDLKNVDDE